MLLISCPGCSAVEWYAPLSCSSWGHESACWWRTFRLGPGMEHCLQNFFIYYSHSITRSTGENSCWSARQSSPTPLTSAFQLFSLSLFDMKFLQFISLWEFISPFCEILKRQINEKGTSSSWWNCRMSSWASGSAFWKLSFTCFNISSYMFSNFF